MANQGSECSMIIQCCCCKKVKSDEGWKREDRKFTTEDHVNHGYCPSCHEQALAQVRNLNSPGHSGRLAIPAGYKFGVSAVRFESLYPAFFTHYLLNIFPHAHPS